MKNNTSENIFELPGRFEIQIVLGSHPTHLDEKRSPNCAFFQFTMV